MYRSDNQGFDSLLFPSLEKSFNKVSMQGPVAPFEELSTCKLTHLPVTILNSERVFLSKVRTRIADIKAPIATVSLSWVYDGSPMS